MSQGNGGAKQKKNGTCNIMAVNPERKITAMTRHNTPHKAWQPSADTHKAELMHSKVQGLRDINYINDILVDDSDYLIGSSFASRQDRLHRIFNTFQGETSTHYIIDQWTWLAKCFKTGFVDTFNSFNPKNSNNQENEGLVVKNPNGKLALCSREKSNTSWLAKSRHPTKLNSF
jgi:hypothetical protein